MRYRFERNITVEGTPYRAGDVVERSAIPAGCLDSLTRQGHITPEQEAPPPAPEPPVTLRAVPPAPTLITDPPPPAVSQPPGPAPQTVLRKDPAGADPTGQQPRTPKKGRRS